MTTPTFTYLDEDEYLTLVSEYQIQTPADVQSWLEAVAAVWKMDYGSVRRHLSPTEASLVRSMPNDRFYRFATGGWSENESIIRAMRENLLAYSLSWRLSARGGLHIFSYSVTVKE